MNEEVLICWFRNLFKARTDSRNVLDFDPGYRVTWTEIWGKMQELGYSGNVIDARILWNGLHKKHRLHKLTKDY